MAYALADRTIRLVFGRWRFVNGCYETMNCIESAYSARRLPATFIMTGNNRFNHFHVIDSVL
jgi:hypothetical protein